MPRVTVYFPVGINDTLICLIPKLDNPDIIQQFRPIGLCNTTYKILAKTIVNKLRPILSTIISPLQSSFISGRSGTDNIMLVQEAIHRLKNKKGKYGLCAIKLDLHKAYDSLEWSFIHQAPTFFDFPPSLINLILHCITSTNLAILINGSPTNFFSPSRGIRQGDPLSPYIFIICMEYLSMAITKEVDGNNWTPLKFGRSRHCLSHCLFADDIILFSRTDDTSITTIQNILNIFGDLSGLRINHSKSRILFSPNTLEFTKNSITRTLNIQGTRDLGKYLGFPLSVKKATAKTFHFLLEKIQSKLQGWKANLLSFAGRKTIIQQCISSIPTYFFQAAHIPKKICDAIDREQKNFLWGSTEGKKKLHLIKWETVTLPKKEGGLGLRQSALLNKANLAKLNWQMMKNTHRPWVQILSDLYLHRNQPLKESPLSFCKSRGSINLRNIIHGNNIFNQGLGWNIGDGKTIKVWSGKWFSASTLRSLIEGPLLPEEDQLLLSDLFDSNGNWNFNNISFHLPPSITDLLKAIPRPHHSKQADNLIWRNSPDGEFSLKSAYEITSLLYIQAKPNVQTPHPPSQSFTWIWTTHTSHRTKLFLWLASQDKLATRYLLHKRNILPDNICPFCPGLIEDTNHVLRKCVHAQAVWMELNPNYYLSTLHIPFHIWIREGCKLSTPSPFYNIPWGTLFAFTCSTIWKSRNKKIFEPNRTQPPPTKTSIKLATEFYSLGPNSGHPPRRKSHILIRWIPPILHWFKLNSDGSALGNPGPAGAGGVIRDASGCWIKGYCRNLGSTNSMLAECWGIRDGLEIALSLKISQLEVEVDCEAIITLLTAVANPNHLLNSIISDCRSLLSQLRHVKISHIYREANRCADALARMGGRLQSNFVTFANCPQKLAFVYDEDLKGICFPRTISFAL